MQKEERQIALEGWREERVIVGERRRDETVRRRVLKGREREREEVGERERGVRVFEWKWHF